MLLLGGSARDFRIFCTLFPDCRPLSGCIPELHQHKGKVRILSNCPGVDPVIMSNLVRDYMPEGEFIEHEELNRLSFKRPADR
jgi:hypothetical protein